MSSNLGCPVEIVNDTGSANAPAANAAAVAPSDSVALTTPTRFLYVGVSGDVTVDTAGGQTAVLFKAVPVGLLPIRATKVYATGTTAGNILALS